ncbi:DNA polymerase alpha subunit B [Drosophila sulfurigaster albostrigata]|uniref:DNA polymerase alpha subunit B n=1 Tax=Drosophila sulfurigaster albostrigata TaxID=89887 RepID=UPI002D21996B|nr:DNA polymerase alpha subunit B [Drosophila sulfurigaster albostrigata]
MEAELKQQFDEMGVEPTAPVLDKCMELAISYNVNDATEFVEQWMAFSLSHLQGDEPTVANLGEFERKVLQTRREKGGSKKPTKSTTTSSLDTSSLANYGLMEEDDPMLNDYVDESTASTLPHTPKAAKNQSRASALKAGVLFSPASYSPKATKESPAATGVVEGKPGDIVDSFGHPKLMAASSWQSQVQHTVPVLQLLRHNDAPLTMSNLRYMNDLLHERCDDLHDRLVDIGQALVEKKLGAKGAAECSWYPQDRHTLDALHMLHAVGLIHSDDDGPLDAHSALLAVLDTEEKLLALNFSQLKSGSIFPGQVVLAKGFIPRGDTFVVEELHTDRKLTPPPPLKVERELQFVVAAGPYTNSTDMCYERLHELLNYLREHRPDVLLLTGPFVEAEHKAINELAETFDAFFEKMIAGIMDVVGSSTSVLLISSQKDAMAAAVYPTPAYTLRKTYPNLQLLADPSLIDLDGITLGVSSTDVLDHLLSHEFAANAGERMHRAINHLFHQGSFYPLSPPGDENMSYDSQLAAKFAQLKQLPNVLILPSDQRHFIRMASDCLVINPGRLVDSKGGTFARFLVTPTAPTATKAPNMFSSVACQIQRI